MTHTVATPQPHASVATSGARFTLSVLDSNFVEIIMGALAGADSTRVKVSRGDISTHVSGDLLDVTQYIADVIAAAAHRGVHATATVMLAYVRPLGLPDGSLAPLTPLAPVGLRARAHWTAPTNAHGATPAIQLARDLDTWSGEEPFVTRLEGDLATVLETVAGGVLLTSETSSTSTTHVTISLNSPSPILDTPLDGP